MTETADAVVIGGGIVGLAAARAMASGGRRVVVLEKEDRVGAHQTGRNSGVIHSGIYYKPGSLKATTCRRGKALLEAYCADRGVAFDTCGKVIVAVEESELPALGRIEERGAENGVACERIGPERLAELEPYASGIAALHVPESGIVSYTGMCDAMVEDITNTCAGGEVRLLTRVTGVRQDGQHAVVETDTGNGASEIRCGVVVNCAGLYCDRVARSGGATPPAKIVPFRGEYYKLKPNAHGLCKNLLYPVPDPSFPFLGVHFTRMIEGGVECGPNAVLAFAREGYTKRDISVRDLAESLSYGGFLRMAAKHWRVGMGEIWRSYSKAAFVKALQRLLPEIAADALEPAPAGVRAQAIAPDGAMVDDFLIVRNGRMVNVYNAPSPAATAALAIGEAIAARVQSGA